MQMMQALPNVAKIVDVTYHGESAWAKAVRIRVLHGDDSCEESYFMKV